MSVARIGCFVVGWVCAVIAGKAVGQDTESQFLWVPLSIIFMCLGVGR